MELGPSLSNPFIRVVRPFSSFFSVLSGPEMTYVLVSLGVPFLERGFCQRETEATKEVWVVAGKRGLGEGEIGDSRGPGCR